MNPATHLPAPNKSLRIQNLIFSAALLFVFFITGCGKSDTTPPVISILTPTANQVFTAGQVVQVKADVSDEEGLHMVHIMVTDQDGNHLVHKEWHFDAKTYSLLESFQVQAGKTYSIEVGADDHHNNQDKKTVTITAN